MSDVRLAEELGFWPWSCCQPDCNLGQGQPPSLGLSLPKFKMRSLDKVDPGIPSNSRGHWIPGLLDC